MRRELRPALSCCLQWYFSFVDGDRLTDMILLWLILIPLIGGILSLLVPWRQVLASRWIAVAAIGLDLLLTLTLWPAASHSSRWLYEFNREWIPQFGIRFHLALDGLSFAF